ncbi:MAG: hypothetical protein ACNA8L_01290 [Luteolibacter sp.]|jgi:hypothetical protein
MKHTLATAIATLCLIPAAISAEEVPEIFKGLFEKDVPVRAQIGMVVPPAEIDKHVAKVEAAARLDPEWFQEYSTTSSPGTPLPFHEKLGLTRAEYDDYIVLWRKREFRPMEEVMLLLRKSTGDNWTIIATGEAGAISTLRYQTESGSFRSPNGELVRIEDIKAEPDSILGEWSGPEWRFDEETTLGKTKENFALGRFADGKNGLVVYRVQEISSEGTRLMDRSLVIRFALGAAGQIQR